MNRPTEEETRHHGKPGSRRDDGQMAENGFSFAGSYGNQPLIVSQASKRRKEEARCRTYWQRQYGRDAELASRGGCTWFGGA